MDISRRDMLALMGSAAAIAATGAHAATGVAEAPSLAAAVKDGKLPPLAQRLPKNPLVVKPMERVGRYGGTFNGVLTGSGDRVLLDRVVGYEYLVRWDHEWTRPIPNLAESVDVGDNARTFIFKLRDGLKWSDGMPCTADDMVFYYEHMVLNIELMPRRPSIVSFDRKPAKVEKIDSLTFKVSFETPNGLFLQRLAGLDGHWFAPVPSHYAKKFHKAFNPNIDAEIAAAQARNWVDLFNLKVGANTQARADWRNPDRPTLNAWILVGPYDGRSTRVTFRRNPYYFKIDTAGNQLPYIDDVVMQVVQDREVTVLKAISGEIDFQARRLSDPKARPVLVQNRDRGQYDFFERIPAHMNEAIFYLNMTLKDPVKRQVMRNRDFRIGVSHALNRQEIIDTIYISEGEPWQTSPDRESPLHNEKLATQYTRYDPKLAGTFLDKAGLDKKDGDGFRLGPDGKRLTIFAEIVSGRGFDDVAQFVARYLRAVGLDFQVRPVERSLWETKQGAGEIEAGFAAGEGGRDMLLDPRWHFPHSSESMFAPAWAGVGPGMPGWDDVPAAARRQMDLFNAANATTDPAEQNRLAAEILAIAQEEFWCMGLAQPARDIGVVRRRMGNVPKVTPAAASYPDPAPSNISQFFIKA
jgi:peptide/nickel transport system substrate-binding protein